MVVVNSAGAVTLQLPLSENVAGAQILAIFNFASSSLNITTVGADGIFAAPVISGSRYYRCQSHCTDHEHSPGTARCIVAHVKMA